MPKSKPEVISLLGEPIFKEGTTTAAINPGHLVELGGAKGLQAQSSAAKDCRRAFVLENDLIGKGIDDAYKAGERIRYGSFHAGQEVYAKLAAAATAVAKNIALEAAGDGTVRKQSGVGVIIGYALEAVDNSSGAKEVFIMMEVA